MFYVKTFLQMFKKWLHEMMKDKERRRHAL